VLEVLYHHAKIGGARISPAAMAAKTLSFFVCFVYFVCSSCFSECCTMGVRQVAPVVVREFYYLFPLKILRNLIQLLHCT